MNEEELIGIIVLEFKKPVNFDINKPFKSLVIADGYCFTYGNYNGIANQGQPI